MALCAHTLDEGVSSSAYLQMFHPLTVMLSSQPVTEPCTEYDATEDIKGPRKNETSPNELSGGSQPDPTLLGILIAVIVFISLFVLCCCFKVGRWAMQNFRTYAPARSTQRKYKPRSPNREVSSGSESGSEESGDNARSHGSGKKRKVKSNLNTSRQKKKTNIAKKRKKAKQKAPSKPTQSTTARSKPRDKSGPMNEHGGACDDDLFAELADHEHRGSSTRSGSQMHINTRSEPQSPSSQQSLLNSHSATPSPSPTAKKTLQRQMNEAIDGEAVNKQGREAEEFADAVQESPEDNV